MRLDPEILDGPPETGARVLALARLADAEEALAHLAGPPQAAALREFRVALRRLHAALAAVSPALAGAVPPDRLARLGTLARRAGPARGAEGYGDWLQGIRGELPAPYRGALDWLADRVERRRRASGDDTMSVAARFGRLAPRLRSDLTAGRPAAAPRPGIPPSFAAFLAGGLRAQTRALREAVMAVAGSGDAAGLDRVRTEGKQLRHLLEPLRASGVKAGEALDALRPLQDLLGDWRDASMAEAAIEAALLEARAEEARRDEAAVAGLRPGLLATLRLAQSRASDLFRRIAAEHLAVKATPVTDAAYAVVAALEARDGSADEHEEGPPPLPERRFLVTAIPPEARGGGVEELEQGWLPGDGRESVGVTRSAIGERWFRARAPGRGRPGRVESISRADFEAFWPLTEGRRIAKRRHLVAAAPGWHFDEYLDRSLVLAVAEEGNGDEPPGWLEPALVREVSAERGYLDEALARRPPRRAS